MIPNEEGTANSVIEETKRSDFCYLITFFYRQNVKKEKSKRIFFPPHTRFTYFLKTFALQSIKKHMYTILVLMLNLTI